MDTLTLYILWALSLLSGASYWHIDRERAKYKTFKTLMTSHLVDKYHAPTYIIIYALALPTAIFIRCTYGKRKNP